MRGSYSAGGGVIPCSSVVSTLKSIISNQIRQINKLLHRKLLGPFVKHLVFDDFGAEHGVQRVAHGLAALVEGLFDDAHEQLFVAAQVGRGVAPHFDDGGFHLRRWVEDVFVNREEIVDVVPSLH